MSFTSLSDTSRLDLLPLVLAGPILRRVTTKSVTVWVALKAGDEVTLSVTPNGGTAFSGKATPVKLGEKLYVVAVTANAGSDVLAPGAVHTYNIWFDLSGNRTLLSDNVVAANQEAASAAISYRTDGDGLPSFVVLPRDPAQLRLIHGSCRKPHGEGFDALTALDTILRKTAKQADRRPQALFLTGDQIYGDDVADALLHESYQLARWIDGSTHVWLRRRKRPGRGEVSTGLRHDYLESR